MNSDAKKPITTPAPTPKPTPTLSVAPQYGGVLRVVETWAFPPRMGVPGRQNVGSSTLEPIVERFLRVDRAGRMIPHLIESWEYNKNGLQLTLHVRKGIKFHDGSELNAKVAKWNLLKAREFKQTLLNIASIDIIDEYTILLNLKRYSNTFLLNLAYSSGFVHSLTAYETYGEEYVMVHPVGTGPFKFISYKPDINIVAERFDNYWQKGKPYLDKIEMLYVNDITKAVNMLRDGEVDAVVNINGASSVALKSEGYVITELPGRMLALLPDTLNSDSPLADRRVRQAMEYAIDRPAIADTLGHGYFALTQLATEVVYGYNPDIEGRPYNPDKAKQLLANAGYPDGFKTKIIGGDASEMPRLFAAIQKYLADVGIKADMEIADAVLWREYRGHKPWHNASLLGHYALDPSFVNTISGFHTRSTYGQTSTLRNFDNIIDEALQARDYETMVKNTQKVVKHIYDEAIVIPITTDLNNAAKSKKVHDLGYMEVHVAHWTPWDTWKEQ